ncbi:hypothetical protein G3T36_18460 [Diaminobutyricibacter tongyongensis]|uniref:Uncharacterized protein n=1 Tax=Leifsonia tongyongensis TaxID=1268043 RepID=A0A6L9Y2I5_9MICO|nr:hypothetical protein [Diaminobutyricibacter tongyongensis]NEN07843.1 hypothetical protein [Diaminobutyricibacter tongyongensis]
MAEYPHLEELPEIKLGRKGLKTLGATYEGGDGWATIAFNLAYTIRSLQPGATVRMRQRVNMLNVDINGGRTLDADTGDSIEKAIDVARHLAMYTCTGCGRPGVLRGSGIYTVLCDGCMALREHAGADAEAATFAGAFSENLGPLYTLTSVCEALNKTPEDVFDHVSRLEILCITAGYDQHLFPMFAFGPGPSLVPHLADVLKILSKAIGDSWTWAQYLAAKRHGQSPIESLLDGNVDTVIAHARAVAAAWSA